MGQIVILEVRNRRGGRIEIQTRKKWLLSKADDKFSSSDIPVLQFQILYFSSLSVFSPTKQKSIPPPQVIYLQLRLQHKIYSFLNSLC